MQPEIAARLNALNRQFYQTFALQFSATRQRLQPGVRRMLASLPAEANLLDLGCGNGELARQLRRQGHQGAYLGLDFSPKLVQVARQGLPAEAPIAFLQADLTDPAWVEALARRPGVPASFSPDYALAFAVLHHIAGDPARQALLKAVPTILAPGGAFILSNWQFLNSLRLRQRIQPWERLGMRTDDVDPGDYVLDWRAGGTGLRYVHHYSETELADLAEATGFRIEVTFYSDGKESNLGLYQVWRPA